MFLRRIIQHLKDQNWTAIGIDLLIVIVGVFLGAEAANWNEARREREGERAFMVRLREDLRQDNAVLRRRVALWEQVRAANFRTDRFIRAGRPCAPGSCWSVLVDFYVGSVGTPVEAGSSALQDLEGSAYPYDRELKLQLFRYYRGLQGSLLNQRGDYRQTLRRRIPIPALQGLVACAPGEGWDQRIDLSCPARVPDADARAIVERLRADEALAGDLNLQAANLIRILPVLELRLRSGDDLLRRVDARLEKR